MVKGNQRQEQTTNTINTKYVGFTSVTLKAVNPSRAELNKLLGKEDSDDDRELSYLTQDTEGNDRIRLTFWLHSADLDKYFVHSFNLTNKVRLSKDGVKTQYINSSCMTSWSDDDGQNLADWFTHFLDKDKNKVEPKEFREALVGEEELASLLRVWLGKLSWGQPGSSVVIDPKNLINEDYTELRELIDSKFVTPFVILVGVRTDENDSEKQYQQVYGKSFLQDGFMDYITQGFKFPNDYARKTWERFQTEVEGPYGATFHVELEPIKVYDRDNDVAAAPGTKAEVTPTNSRY